MGRYKSGLIAGPHWSHRLLRVEFKEKNQVKIGKNYKASSIGELSKVGRVTLNGELRLTGSEVSINNLPAGVSIPFVHAHKRNEEVYIVLSGKGSFYIDGEEFAVEEGDVLRLDPAAARCMKASDASGIRYVCIQTEAKSLVQFTENDGVPVDVKPSWL
jgi:mannose-6-phosphate isomerase-like protein (cupin superfamily)